jgi:hypothetical protein
MKRLILNAVGLALIVWGEKLKELGFGLTPPQKVQSPEPFWCHASTRHGYLRYCRRKAGHVEKHKDGDFEWGDGESVKPAAPLDEDIGQGEGCEGGKCEVRK